MQYRCWMWGGTLLVAAAAACTDAPEDGPSYPDPGVLPTDTTWGGLDEVAFDATYYVRPPGETYGTGDGSSWADAYSDLPPTLERGARYYLASGEYYVAAVDEAGVWHRFEDDPDGETYIGVFKATGDDHGTDDGWDEAFGTGVAELGPIELVTPYYVLDGQIGSKTSGHGIHVTTRDCDNDQAKVVRFPWDTVSHHVILCYLDLEHCGDLPVQQPPHDVIYGNPQEAPITHVKIQHCYLHDANRTHFLMRNFAHVLIEDSYFARSGQFQETSCVNVGDTSDVTIRRSVFEDSQSTFISLRGADNVGIYSNVFFSRLDHWEVYSVIENTAGLAAWHVNISGNTFYGLQGLNTGIRVRGELVGDVTVTNNLWAGCRTNQIMLTGEHDYNAFWDNLRVDGDEPQNLDERIEEAHVQVLGADPFVDAAGGDFHLAVPTEAGMSLDAPYDIDLDGVARGADGTWDRGALEYDGG